MTVWEILEIMLGVPLIAVVVWMIAELFWRDL